MVTAFFNRLTDTIEELGIGPSETWNEDECGIRIGCLRERIQVIVTATKRKMRLEVSDPSNRESITLIASANATGDIIPTWIVFKVAPTESWADIEGDDNICFTQSPTGFSNSEITFDWIQEFNLWSWKHSAKSSTIYPLVC